MPNSEKKEENDPITPDLCKAYRGILEEKIKGLERTFKVGLAISTILIGLLQIVLELI